jgi:anti-sigma regulatory factor (Ser/Thr protein kinase)
MMATPTRSGPEEPAKELELELERNPEAPSVARAAIVGFCQDRDVSSQATATLMLLTSEIVTNAVIHPDAGPEATLGFSARVNGDFIRIEVTDQGSGFTPKPRNPDQVGGGYGLCLLEAEAERWGVDPRGQTTVWFEVGT